MRRKIIFINEELCTGCGQCIPDCPKGALQLIDGKARIISDIFCDGLGACVGTCPKKAITIIEREAGAYDENLVMEKIVRQGASVIKAHLEHLTNHGETDLYDQAVFYLKNHALPVPITPISEGYPENRQNCHPFSRCPGTTARTITRDIKKDHPQPVGTGESELLQWPVQLHLVHPAHHYFDGADLLISADCVPFAFADFHQKFLKGKIVVIFCPKLDSDIDGYIKKMASILSDHAILSITIVHMEVPCCSGVRFVVDSALKQSGKTILVTEFTISIRGEVL